MAQITQQYLQECFEYHDGKLYWKERPMHHFNSERIGKGSNTSWAGTEAGCVHYHNKNHEYRYVVKVSSNAFKRSRLVWILHNGDIPQDMMIDHIDGNTLNDRLDNLRVVSNEVNSSNRKKHKRNTSGVTGVTWHSRQNKWAAYGRENGKQKQLYCGDDFFEAVCARKSFEVKHPHMTTRHGK